MKSKGIRKVLADNAGFFFILPWLIGFILFKVYPFASSLYYSFTNYDLFNGISKTGMMNYNKIFTDSDIKKAFFVTFKYAIFDVPLKLMFALFIAYILNFKLKGVNSSEPRIMFRLFWAGPLPSQFCGELYLIRTV